MNTNFNGTEYCDICGSKLDKDTGFCAGCASPDFTSSDDRFTKIITKDEDATAGDVFKAVDGLVADSTGPVGGIYNRTTGGTVASGATVPVGGSRYNAAVNAAATNAGSSSEIRRPQAKKPKGLIGKYKELPRPARIAIVIGIITLFILIFAGILALVNNALSLTPVPQRLVSERPVEPTPVRVQAVRIMHDGTVFSDGDIEVGESLTLTVAVEPDSIDDEVIWTNHNTAVIEVTYNNAKRTDITVTGTGRGLVRLTAKVGGVEAVCIFRVHDGPPPDAESVVITHDGAAIEKADIYVGDSLTLRVLVEPEGVVDEINFTSSNAGILNAVASTYILNEIVVTGVSEGSATLTVTVGDISVECVFTVEIRYVEVPHPFAVSLQEFFSGAYVSTAAYYVNMPGIDEPVVLARRFTNEHDSAYRFMYLREGNFRVYDFFDFFWPTSRVQLSDNNHLVTITADEGIWFNVHLFENGEIKFDAAKLWTILDPNHFNGFWHNDRQVTEAEFEALLRLYGLRTDNVWADRPDNTAAILAMTVLAPAT